MLQYSTLDLTRTTGGHGLALRATATGTRVQTAPTWRIPGWGGGTVLRHGRFLQYQSPILAAGVVEWRQPITPTWGATAFIEGGHASAWVGGVGSGIRLALPPRPSANLRLDIAWGGLLGETGSLGVSTGWGTAF